MVRLAGVEPATYGFEVRHSIQLSYRRIKKMSTIVAKKRHLPRENIQTIENLLLMRACFLPRNDFLILALIYPRRLRN